MSASVVQAQYEELEQIAARFAAAAEQQQALQERVNRQVEVLRSGGWQGKGLTAFLDEMDTKVFSSEQRLCAALVQASQTTQHIVGVLQAAEQNAASPFDGSHVGQDVPTHSTSTPPSDTEDTATTPAKQQDAGANGGNGQSAARTPAEIRNELEARIRSDLGRLPNENGEQCVRWVQDRVENITGRRPPAIGVYGSDVGADNYRFMFDGVYFSAANADSLVDSATPGAILVWTRSQLKNGAGHVAVVERVTSDGIWISEANWDANSDGKKTASDGIRFIKREELARLGLYMISAGATAASPGQFAARKKATA